MKKKNFFIRFLDYLRPSWEGDDELPSRKKLSILAFVIMLLVYAWFVDTMVKFYVFLVFGVLYAIETRIATWAQITTLLKFTLPRLRDRDIRFGTFTGMYERDNNIDYTSDEAMKETEDILNGEN